MKSINLIFTFLFISLLSNAQVGVGTNDPKGALDVENSNQGVVLSRVSLSSTTIQAPVINPSGGALVPSTLVYNTASVNDVVPGFYYWDGVKWVPLKSDSTQTGTPTSDEKWDLNGNEVTTSNFLGTKNNMPLVFRTNNTRRMTLLDSGELVIRDLGLTSTHPAYLTVTTADNKHGLFSLSSSSTGSAVFARKISGSGGNAIVGESSVSSGNSSIAGVFKSGGSTSFHYNELTGISAAGLNYGVSSRFFGTSGIKAGYHSRYSTTNWYFGGRNGTTNFVTNGRVLQSNANKGFLFSSLGPGTISTIVKDTNKNEVTMHAVIAPEIKVTDYGTAQLINGRANVTFDSQLQNVISATNPDDIKIFIQLEGDCNGVYVANKSIDGFEVRELQNGTNSVKFSYTVVANRKSETFTGDTGDYPSDYSGRFIPIAK